MQSNILHSEKISLQLQLQSNSEKFDNAINHEEDCQAAKIIYKEIKKLRERLKEINQL
jgi:hypothetical protein